MFDQNSSFTNPILESGADPWIYRHDGWYYYAHTVGTHVEVRRSASITGLAQAAPHIVWTPPAEGPYSRSIWAPELHRLQGKWYFYFAADDGDNRNHRMYVLEAEDPLGPYTFAGYIGDKSDRWAIDGTVLEKPDGSLYFIWSGWEGNEDVSQHLYIARMASPTEVVGERVEISRPTYPWEQIGKPTVNEGPQVLLRNGRVFLVYSASGSWTDDYCLGLLWADADADLENPESWHKEPSPVFSKTTNVFGPGHCSFVSSPDGKEDWILYHAAKRQGSGWDRDVRAQPFTWDEHGKPVFGQPAAPGVALRKPSGE